MTLARVLGLCLLLGLSPFASAEPPSPSPLLAQEEVGEQIERLRTELERAPKELIVQLARSKDREACAAMVEVYGEVDSLGAKLRLVRAFRLFVGAAGCEREAMQHLLDVATTDPVRELREAAVEELARSGRLGREYLAILIESPADSEVRKKAMEAHVKGAQKSDTEFYERLWKAVAAPSDDGDKGKGKKKRDEEVSEAPRLGRPLIEVAELAFEALARDFPEEVLVPRTGSSRPKIRTAAQKELYRRGGELALELARSRFQDGRELVENRVQAAEYLLAQTEEPEELFEDIAKIGTHREVSSKLLRHFSQLFAKRAPEDLKADLAKSMSRGKPNEKLFALAALEGYEDERGKLEKSVLKLVGDKDRDVREAAATDAAQRRIEGAVEAIESRLEKAEDDVEASVYLRALTRLYGQDPAWWERVRAWTTDERGSFRNAAVRTLIERGGDDVPEVLQAALTHPDWATRLIAVKAVEERRESDGVGWLVAAMDGERGRMATEISEALVRLTGQDFRRNASAWARWWADNQADFEVISEEELEALEEEAAARRLEEKTRAAEFFGLKIDSERVVFVIDVSGSMEQRLGGRYGGGDGVQRMDAARIELLRVLEKLDPEALFGVVTFSDRVRPFEEGLLRASEENVEDAKKFVNKLNASGGTNLYGGLQEAFEHADSDTIVVLSDGEPSMGVTTDPDRIRTMVQKWNRDRGVRIHAVAIGVDLDILRWLAEDSGGQHAFLQ